jgi:hypothetical protein
MKNLETKDNVVTKNGSFQNPNNTMSITTNTRA